MGGTADIYKYRHEHGDNVPHVVPAGKDNPMGKYALRLSNPTYLIHGTDDPVGIGRRSSGGCIRLYPQDIEQLFAMVKVGTEVRISTPHTRQQLKIIKSILKLILPLYEQRILWRGNMTAALDAVKALGNEYQPYVNWSKVKQIVYGAFGRAFCGRYDPGMEIF